MRGSKGQMKLVLNHLKTHVGLTSMEAFKLYGCTRLAAKIFDLRESGLHIESVPTHGLNRLGEDTPYVEYRLIKEDKKNEYK